MQLKTWMNFKFKIFVHIRALLSDPNEVKMPGSCIRIREACYFQT